MKLPHIKIYTDSVSGGNNRAFFMLINPKYKDDKGLHAHEYEHVKQWYLLTMITLPLLLMSPWLSFVSVIAHPLLYNVSRKYRQWAEVEAHKVQLEYNPDFEWAVSSLVNTYNLKLTKSEALKLLIK